MLSLATMLKFAKSVPYLPDLVRSRPVISAEEQALARATPPHVVPAHCKPWLDGQAIGWTLFYGYLTPVRIMATAAGQIEVENGEQLKGETNQPRIIDRFARTHFGLGCGYTLVTPPGFVCLIIPPTQPPPALRPLTGLIETDWYPRQLFLVFELPRPGEVIALDYKAELARVIVVPRPEQMTAEPLTAAEETAVLAQDAAYQQAEKETPGRWTAASGDSFTHLYKEWSKKYRSGQLSPLLPDE
jgi:hypothetical protein